MSQSKILPPHPTRHLARLTFVAFLFTFIASRVLVIFIMARRLPDLFLHLGGTHVHHLNYGIFLLSTIGALLLSRQCSRHSWPPVRCCTELSWRSPLMNSECGFTSEEA